MKRNVPVSPHATGAQIFPRCANILKTHVSPRNQQEQGDKVNLLFINPPVIQEFGSRNSIINPPAPSIIGNPGPGTDLFFYGPFWVGQGSSTGGEGGNKNQSRRGVGGGGVD